MRGLFGTDGIRGVFNQEPITEEMGYRLGRAVVEYFKGKEGYSRIVLGRDTRLSGEVLESAVASGVLSKGGNPLLLGEIPTPGVAFITRDIGADAGIVISASHNPYEYNGFKIFSGEGYKLTDKEEIKIENLLLSEAAHGPLEKLPEENHAEPADDLEERYIGFLQHTLPGERLFKDMRIILDCANGATYHVAPILFERMGAQVEALFVSPDGKNINEGCGSQHPETLSARVVEKGADLGLAFDGDGDRLIAVDEKGNVLTGDQILTICAKTLKDRGDLKNNLVVSTVMSNMGFRIALDGLGIDHVATDVGDRYVLEEMRGRGGVFGGEDSGHIIFLQYHTTGDGLLSALQLVSAVVSSGVPLSTLSQLMSVYPQVLVNVPVKNKPELSSIPEVQKAMKRVENGLGQRGRVLLRYSGTEPLCRVMVEGEVQEEINARAQEIADVIRERLG
ncbi:MAG: phosphoglucosamine mutase [Deltaproteobacteria bacterium]|nr:phosphoglucosamine mutase [Deltaproteobacteria bacterium]